MGVGVAVPDPANAVDDGPRTESDQNQSPGDGDPTLQLIRQKPCLRPQAGRGKHKDHGSVGHRRRHALDKGIRTGVPAADKIGGSQGLSVAWFQGMQSPEDESHGKISPS
jgi:hypothetical protein